MLALVDADVQAEGCYIHEDGSYGCDPASDGTYNSQCASELALTVTEAVVIGRIRKIRKVFGDGSTPASSSSAGAASRT